MVEHLLLLPAEPLKVQSALPVKVPGRLARLERTHLLLCVGKAAKQYISTARGVGEGGAEGIERREKRETEREKKAIN